MPSVDAAVHAHYPSASTTLDGGSPPSNAASHPLAWSTAQSAQLYGVDGWGAPYFSISSAGNISVRPYGGDTLRQQEIDLLAVVKHAGGLGLQPPLIVRFPEVLKNRLDSLQSAFEVAIESQRYKARYQGVYPVKCNHDRFMVEDIVNFGSGYRFGLEAGSKPELLLAMSCLCNGGSAEALLVCNGFKDFEYISLALIARKLKLNSVIVIEQEQELDVVIDVSKKLCVRPVIGVRAKLRTKHAGHFSLSSGEKGKFGLKTSQILKIVERLGQNQMLSCLQLLHFHIGSQIPSTSLLADAVVEAAQIYCELVRLGAAMEVIDVGGGLGIDYDGSRSSENPNISVGYTLEEYAATVVAAVRRVCDGKAVTHPVICSESGRGIISHHSVLVLEAISSSSDDDCADRISSAAIQPLVERMTDEAVADYRSLFVAVTNGDREKCAVHVEKLKQKCIEQFKEGDLEMEQLSAVDGACELVMKAMGIQESISTYNVNLSIFTSIPDIWGIGQVFPIVPIHRLRERPVTRGILSDLTCDSDGKIARFLGGESSLPLHQLRGDGGGEKYYLGMFLGGAYQEALGGLHNLFGGPSVVRVVHSNGPDGFVVTSGGRGRSCADVLRVVRHNPEHMMRTLARRVVEIGESNDELINDLVRSFNNMPYLGTTKSDQIPYI